MSDTQLKQALTKMLPEYMMLRGCRQHLLAIGDLSPVEDTELLHLCWLAEDALKEHDKPCFDDELSASVEPPFSAFGTIHATWQQRVTALAKVKGIEIV